MASQKTSYEVYALQDKRWIFHAYYGRDERDVAIDEAMIIEKYPNITAAVVVKDVFNEAVMSSMETIIYHTPTLKDKPSLAKLSGGKDRKRHSEGNGFTITRQALDATQARANFQIPQDNHTHAPQRPRKNQRAHIKPNSRKNVEARAQNDLDVGAISVSFVSSTIISICFTVGTYFLLRVLGLIAQKNVTIIILILVFAVTFLMFFVPRITKIFNAADAKAKKKIVTANPNAQARHVPKSKTKQKNNTGDEVREKIEDTDEEEFFNEQTELPTDLPDFLSDSAAFIDEEDNSHFNLKAESSCDAVLAKIIEEARGQKGGSITSDAFLRFGLIIYMAGAAAEIGRIMRMQQSTILDELIRAVTKLDMHMEQATVFCSNMDSYMGDENYRIMYERGEASQKDPRSNVNAAQHLSDALHFWLYPNDFKDGKRINQKSEDLFSDKDLKEEKEVASVEKKVEENEGETKPVKTQSGSQLEGDNERKFVAVLFTDIVNSTLNQQTKGEDWLMEVIRAHNEIIREAIIRFKGTEIKHTGDGIMASFPAVVNSVDAALAMQAGVIRFSGALPEMAFQIRVGISAGEPIHENGDLFGTPVNMAARVLDKAGAEKIAVSSIVKEMCRGKNFDFQEAGAFELKGFDELQVVYEVSDRKGMYRAEDIVHRSNHYTR